MSIVAEIALYLPISLFGLLVDRRGPAPASFIAAFLFGSGYLLAAFVYRHNLSVSLMTLAFTGVGMGTCCMYLGAVTTCAKNFGRGKHKGLALALPIASFGLGGMWQSQVGSRLLYEEKPDGSRGDVDVYKYFLFLSGLLFGVGLIGSLLLRIVNEGDLIAEAVDELEHSGLLNETEFYRSHTGNGNGYGTIERAEDDRPTTAEEAARAERKRNALEEQRKKAWLLNEETRRYISDPTMWLLTAGFFLVTGPGEAFINNLGTIIGTLYQSPTDPAQRASMHPTEPATHVSIVAVASTVARILSGTLSDLFAAPSDPHQSRRGPNSLASSIASLDPLTTSIGSARSLIQRSKPTISRLTILLFFTVVFSVGQIVLASGAVQWHASSRFWIVSALIGTGYGAVFSLVPIVISCVWGVENFATNWGITAMAPAPGAALWGIIYASVYEHSAEADLDSGSDVRLCYGVQCYALTFWLMTVSSWIACVLWLLAWKGPNGWYSRRVVV